MWLSTNLKNCLNDLSLLEKGIFFQEVRADLIAKGCCQKSYLRGAFLAGGSINSPQTSAYHLEIQSFSQRQAEIIQTLANEFQLNAKVSHNKRGFITYLKEAERIADFLRLSGATQSLFDFEDSRIKRDFKNSINRVINCDIANERKAMDAANRQLIDIDIVEKNGIDHLPKSIQEVIFLRKLYPEATLLELSYLSTQHFENQVSKSALNHRFRALHDLATHIAFTERDHD